ncbi:hypothetical protein [Amycolatopsis magusensis]|uniref:hypothetical protein n=1 Tax=Amycolatopsis magusensis TaxID=882444 RepID=UPI0037B2376A
MSGAARARLSRRGLLITGLGLVAGACAPPPNEPAPTPPLAAPPTPLAADSPVPPTPKPAPVDAGLLVGFCGAPSAKALGKMTGDLAVAGQELAQQLQQFPGDRPATPVVELIATAAHRTPGADGMYRTRASESTVADYLDQARAMNGLLLLNIQPGRAPFLAEVQAYERWLAEPDVGVALDPEWAVPEGVVPGEEFGRTSGEDLDAVAEYLSGLVTRHGLPRKLMAYHQVSASVVRDEAGLRAHDGVVAMKIVDGIGSAAAKKATWDRVMKTKPDHVRAGFKLFYDEDTRDGASLMTPAEVLALEPTPGYVVYE